MIKKRLFWIGVFVLVVLLLGIMRLHNRFSKETQISPHTSGDNIVTPGDHAFQLTYDGLERHYIVHVPNTYSHYPKDANSEDNNSKDNNSKVPLVIYLHGGGGRAQAGINDNMESFADNYGFLLVLPEGTGPIKDKLLTWNSGTWPTGDCCGTAVADQIDDVGFIAAVIAEVENTYSIDTTRIYATGISNGGMMAYRLACELSEKLAAVAIVASPAIPEDCTPSRKISILHIHGTLDPCVPYDGSIGAGCIGKQLDPESAQEQVDFWKKENVCSETSSQVYAKGNANCIRHACQNNSEVEFCTITDGGHTWPSGNQYLPASKVGAVSYDLSFDQIWLFFLRHHLDEY
jgi:polyhydroxybutyrate depolymerase